MTRTGLVLAVNEGVVLKDAVIESWSRYSLADQKMRRGDGIIYCLNFDKTILLSEQRKIINAFTELGVSFYEKGFPRLSYTSDRHRSRDEQNIIPLFLEELSSFNDALRYNASGYGDYKTITGLTEGLIKKVKNADSNDFDAKQIVIRDAPQIISDLFYQHDRNEFLTNSEIKSLKSLDKFLKTNMATFYRE